MNIKTNAQNPKTHHPPANSRRARALRRSADRSHPSRACLSTQIRYPLTLCSHWLTTKKIRRRESIRFHPVTKPFSSRPLTQITDLFMKMRSDCALNVLTPDQLNDIFDSLASGTSFRAMQQRCLLPPPEGFGIRVQLPTLHRFFKAERRRRHAEDLAENKFNDLASSDPERLYENVRVELAHACYDLANYSDTPNVNVLARITHRLELLRIEQQP